MNNVQFYDPQKALSYLLKSLEVDPSDATTWYHLGRVHMIRSDYTAAYDAFQQAVNRDSRNPIFWCSIGVLYYQISQYRDALDAYTRAIRLNPYISEVWYDLGTLYETCNNQLSDALDAYKQAARLDPENIHIRKRLETLTAQLENPQEAAALQQQQQQQQLSTPSNGNVILSNNSQQQEFNQGSVQMMINNNANASPPVMLQPTLQVTDQVNPLNVRPAYPADQQPQQPQQLYSGAPLQQPPQTQQPPHTETQPLQQPVAPPSLPPTQIPNTLPQQPLPSQQQANLLPKANPMDISNANNQIPPRNPDIPSAEQAEPAYTAGAHQQSVGAAQPEAPESVGAAPKPDILNQPEAPKTEDNQLPQANIPEIKPMEVQNPTTQETETHQLPRIQPNAAPQTLPENGSINALVNAAVSSAPAPTNKNEREPDANEVEPAQKRQKLDDSPEAPQATESAPESVPESAPESAPESNIEPTNQEKEDLAKETTPTENTESAKSVEQEQQTQQEVSEPPVENGQEETTTSLPVPATEETNHNNETVGTAEDLKDEAMHDATQDGEKHQAVEESVTTDLPSTEQEKHLDEPAQKSEVEENTRAETAGYEEPSDLPDAQKSSKQLEQPKQLKLNTRKLLMCQVKLKHLKRLSLQKQLQIS